MKYLNFLIFCGLSGVSGLTFADESLSTAYFQRVDYDLNRVATQLDDIKKCSFESSFNFGCVCLSLETIRFMGTSIRNSLKAANSYSVGAAEATYGLEVQSLAAAKDLGCGDLNRKSEQYQPIFDQVLSRTMMQIRWEKDKLTSLVDKGH